MINIKTYQDFLAISGNEKEKVQFIQSLITWHKGTPEYRTAKEAVEYDRQNNVTIKRYQKMLYTMSGHAVPDNYSANYKIASNFFNRFVTQENQYLLGNGATLEDERNKDRLGKRFDTQLQKLGRTALVQGVGFGFWNYDHLEVFELTEFAPLYDEETGALMAGVRYWQIDATKPMRVTLFEVDGCTDYIERDKVLTPLTAKRAYTQIVRRSEVAGTEIYDGENMPGFPVLPLWGNPHKQSELVGLRDSIDAYDLIQSGFANDLDDVSQIYWILKNTNGMEDADIAQFLQRVRRTRAAVIDDDAGASAEPYTVDIPYESRVAYLERLEQNMYNDYQALNISVLQGGQKTATEINAAYQPFDNKVDQYEYCVLDFLDRLFELIGIEDNATFKRSRIVNQIEETQMVLMAASYLDDETILKKLPFLTPDEVEEILKRKDAEDAERYTMLSETQQEPQDELKQPQEGEGQGLPQEPQDERFER